jgi:hypothetical protein
MPSAAATAASRAQPASVSAAQGPRLRSWQGVSLGCLVCWFLGDPGLGLRAAHGVAGQAQNQDGP